MRSIVPRSLRLTLVALGLAVTVYGVVILTGGWIGDRKGPSATADVRGTVAHLRAGSFNVNALPLGLAADTESRLRKMPAELRRLDLGVIGLQEVWTPDARKVLAEGLASSHTTCRSNRGGLLLLSQYPIREEEFTPFPRHPGMPIVEALAGKGALSAILDLPVGPLRVIVTHLCAYAADARDAQVEFLVSVVLPTRTDIPTLVLADLNLWATEDRRTLTAGYASILARGFADANPPRRTASEELDPGRPTFHGWPRTAADAATYPDHIFFRSGVGLGIVATGFRIVMDTPDSALSDHDMLLAEFDFRAGGR